MVLIRSISNELHVDVYAAHNHIGHVLQLEHLRLRSGVGSRVLLYIYCTCVSKYEKLWKSMWAVTINCEFNLSLPSLSAICNSNAHHHDIAWYRPTCTSCESSTLQIPLLYVLFIALHQTQSLHILIGHSLDGRGKRFRRAKVVFWLGMQQIQSYKWASATLRGKGTEGCGRGGAWWG